MNYMDEMEKVYDTLDTLNVGEILLWDPLVDNLNYDEKVELIESLVTTHGVYTAGVPGKPVRIVECFKVVDLAPVLKPWTLKVKPAPKLKKSWVSDAPKGNILNLAHIRG